MRRLSRTVRHFLARGVVLVVAGLLSVLPAWSAARTITALCAVPEPSPQTAPSEAFQEEEEAPEAALHRHHIEIGRAVARRPERTAPSESVVRHRTEWDMERVSRRWATYRAPPRAPPPRLLN